MTTSEPGRPDETLTVGFVGLGAMGRPMAANLARAFPTRVWNRTLEVAERHASTHGTVAAPLPEVAVVDVLFTCLPTTADVIEVADRLGPHLRAGTVWIDCTSGEPAASRELAARLADAGVTYLDAPVSGGTDGAEAGRLTVMVGGEGEVLDRVRPVLDALAAKVVHVGPVGAGHAVKAVNNTLLAANLLAAAEGLVTLARAGVRATTALEVINAASGRSNATENLITQRVVTREFPVTFTLGLLTKDIAIALDVVREVEVSAPLLDHVLERFRDALAEVGADVDHSAIARVVESAAGVELA